MKIIQLGILPGMLFLQLMLSSSAMACDADTLCDGPPSTTKTLNNSRSNIKNNLGVNPVIGPSRAVGTKGVNGALTTNSNDTTTISNSPNNVNVNANLTSRETTTSSRAVSTKGVNGALTAEGNIDATSTDASTTSNSPNIKNGIAGDGVNVLSNTRLSTAISGNAVGTDQIGTSVTPVAGAGNSINGSSFTGATGITMVNMSSGHNSNVQVAVTVVPTPATTR